jgi:hypothetical protein
LDPKSAEQVLSVQIQSHEILAMDGMISLRPRQLIEGTYVDDKEVTANTTLYALERMKPQFLGRRGYITGTGRVVPPCTFNQKVRQYGGSPSIFDIYDYPPPSSDESGSLDRGGVELSYFWQGQPSGQPPLPNLGNSNWPSTLSHQAIEALSNFPKTFHRSLNPQPIHGVDIAGESFQLRAIHG